MSAVKKFLFETSFDVDDEDEAAEDEDEEVAVEPEPEEELPTFSEEDLIAAREQGFAEGKQAGIAKAKAGLEREILDTVMAMNERLDELFALQREASVETTRDAIAVAAAIARKVLPGLNERNALDEVARFVESTIERLIEEPKVTVHINESLKDEVSDRLGRVITAADMNRELVLLGDKDLPLGDCRIEWNNGGAERKVSAVLEDIDDIIERNIVRERAAHEVDDDGPAEAATETSSPSPAPAPAPKARAEPGTEAAGDTDRPTETPMDGQAPRADRPGAGDIEAHGRDPEATAAARTDGDDAGSSDATQDR